MALDKSSTLTWGVGDSLVTETPMGCSCIRGSPKKEIRSAVKILKYKNTAKQMN